MSCSHGCPTIGYFLSKTTSWIDFVWQMVLAQNQLETGIWSAFHMLTMHCTDHDIELNWDSIMPVISTG